MRSRDAGAGWSTNFERLLSQSLLLVREKPPEGNRGAGQKRGSEGKTAGIEARSESRPQRCDGGAGRGGGERRKLAGGKGGLK